MSVAGYDDLRLHIGHDVVVVGYGGAKHGGVPVNVAVECESCGEVLLDYDLPSDPPVSDALAPPPGPAEHRA